MKKVLIVDDEEFSREMLATMVRENDCEADQAVDGMEGVMMFSRAILHGEPYAFVFCDIMMPVLDGLNAVRIMRELERHDRIPAREETCIVMVSMLGDPHNVVASMYESGASTYMIKPLQPREVSRVLLDPKGYEETVRIQGAGGIDLLLGDEPPREDARS